MDKCSDALSFYGRGGYKASRQKGEKMLFVKPTLCACLINTQIIVMLFSELLKLRNLKINHHQHHQSSLRTSTGHRPPLRMEGLHESW